MREVLGFFAAQVKRGDEDRPRGSPDCPAFLLFIRRGRGQDGLPTMMKYLLLVLLAGALAYVVRDNMAKTEQINAVEEQNAALNTEIQELRKRMGPTAASVPRAGEAAASTPAKPAGMNVQTVSCRVCSGTGKVQKKSLSGSVRPTPCTVCAGRGSKDLQLPAGA